MSARDSSAIWKAEPEPLAVAPERLSEEEFAKLAAGLVPDPVTEWLWRVSAAGPLKPDAFEETAG